MDMLWIKYNSQTFAYKQNQRCGWLGPFKSEGRDHCSCEIVARIAFQVHVLTPTINVLVGQTSASVQKIHCGCFKIVLKAVKCVWEFLVSGFTSYLLLLLLLLSEALISLLASINFLIYYVRRPFTNSSAKTWRLVVLLPKTFPEKSLP